MSAPAKQSSARRALAYIGAAVVVVGTLGVAVAAFTLSYDAIRSVGIAANTRPSWAWMLPVSIDGAMGVATVAVLLLKQLGRSTWYPWVVVATGVLVSAGCNGLHAGGSGGEVELPGDSARAVGVIPPLMLALSVHLLAVLVKALSAGGPDQLGPLSATEVMGTLVAPEQVAPTTSVTEAVVPRTGAPEQTEQVTLPEPVRILPTPRTDRTEQTPAPALRPVQLEPVRKPAPRPVRTEQVADLPGPTEQVAEQTSEQEPGRDSEQAEVRPRPDAELIPLVREQAAEQIASGKLTRYRVEQITGAHGRQADRVLAAVMSGAEQDSEQTELAGASR